MTRLGAHAKDEIRQQMAGLKGADARSRAAAIAERYGVAEGTVYHITHDMRPARKQRTDAGATDEIAPETWKAFLSLTVGKNVSTRRAREFLVERGHVLPSISTLNRLRQTGGLTRRENQQDLRPFVRFEAEYPNRVWQMDSSGSDMFFRRRDGAIEYVSPLKQTKNKPAPKGKDRIWFVIVKDDHSRCVCAEYVEANDTQCWLTVLGHAAAEKGADFPFCGLPDEIYTDNDSVVGSESNEPTRFRRVCAMFDPPVRITTALPYIGKRSKGKVENSVGFIKQDFERVHAPIEVPNLAQVVDQRHHEGAVWHSLAEANAALRTWLLWYNNRIHGTTNIAPFARWMAGVPAHPPRVIDEPILTGLMLMDEVAATVNGDLTVWAGSTRWALPHVEPFLSMVGSSRKVKVWWSPKYERSVFVDVAGRSWEIHPVGAPHAWGEFHSIPLPAREHEKLRIAKAADPDMAAPAISLGGTGTPARQPASPPKWLSGRHETARVPDVAPPASVMKTLVQALIWAREKGHVHRQVRPDERAEIEAIFAGRESIPLDELVRWAEIRRSVPQSAAGGAA